MKYSTYLFDLDGTLYSRDKLLLQLIEEQYFEFREELNHRGSKPYLERVIELDAHGYKPKELLYAQIAKEWDLGPVVQGRLLEHFWERYDAFCEIPVETLTTLQHLKNQGYQLGIITNGQTERQNKKIDTLGIRDYFDVVLISEAEGLKKPNAEIFHRAVKRCESSLIHSVFIGDHPIADIDGARDAGLAAIWKKVPYWNMTRSDVITIESLLEILN